MRMNQAGLDLLKSFESCRLKAYQDIAGVWTIGWGCTEGVKPGEVITQEQADAMLKVALGKFERGVTASLKVPVTPNQFSALVCLAYNIGLNALGSSTLLKYLNSNRIGEAADQFLVWDHCRGSEVKGLLRRREAERALFTQVT